jgi:hypothetical protein
MRYQIVSRERNAQHWELGEFILTGKELDEALHGLIYSTTMATAHIRFEGRPVFMQVLGTNEILYVAFKLVQ